MRLNSVRDYVFSSSLLLLSLLPSSVFAGESALVIIDMQQKFITRGGHETKPENVKILKDIFAAQTEAIKNAMTMGIPIIFEEYENHGDTDDQLRNLVKGYQNVVYFKKTSDGMFERYNSHLEKLTKFLKEKDVTNLLIMGANGGACVKESIEGALKNEYNVVAYSHGIADFNFEKFTYPYKYDGITSKPKEGTFRQVTDVKGLFAEVKKTVTIVRPVLDPDDDMMCIPPGEEQWRMFNRFNHDVQRAVGH